MAAPDARMPHAQTYRDRAVGSRQPTAHVILGSDNASIPSARLDKTLKMDILDCLMYAEI
jgi:hypothetical protein